MLKVYGAQWCPHCVETVKHLERKNIPFEYIDIETQPDDVVQKIVDVNGGEDWVVPTLEFEGRFREGKVYDAKGLDRDLKKLGVPA